MQGEIRPGYKQTEVGVIPEDWDVALARDVLQINRGRVISHHDISKSPGPYPVYSSQTKDNGVMGHINTFDFEGEYLTWTTDGANAGTVFYRNGKFNCTNVCGAGRPQQPSRTSVAYLSYYLNTVAWKHVSHVGNPKLMSGPFGGIPVVYPPPSEQRAIAAALADADALIAALEGVIAKKRDLKQAAMQHLLTGKTRLPGFSGEWEVKRLGELLTVRHGRSQKEVEVAGGRYPILATGGEIGRTNSFLYDKPSVLIGRKGTIDDPKFIDTPFWTVDTLFYTEIAATVVPRFIYNKFLMIDWRSYNEASGVPSLSSKTIEKIEIRLPSTIAEQTAIAEVLSDMDGDLAALDAQVAKTRAVKQGMMQELLTGKVRLV